MHQKRRKKRVIFVLRSPVSTPLVLIFFRQTTQPPHTQSLSPPPPLSHAFSTCGGGGKYLPRKTATKNKAEEDVGRKRDKRKRQQKPKIGTLSSFSKKQEFAKSSFECQFPHRKKVFTATGVSRWQQFENLFLYRLVFPYKCRSRKEKKSHSDQFKWGYTPSFFGHTGSRTVA